jgi:tRNA 2-thiouridine synthesizing protein B
MSCLHIVRTSAFQSSELTECLSIIGSTDAMLLMDDGCYNLQHVALQQKLRQNQMPFYVIAQHVLARSIKLPTAVCVNPIALENVAALIFNFDNSITWQ